MPENHYSMSFTTAALAKTESRLIAELYLIKKDWRLVSQEAVESNTIQARTASSLKRVTREVISRLRLLPDELVNLVSRGNRIESNAALWMGVCIRYPFIGEFALEVLSEKFMQLDLSLSYDDYDRFFYRKAEWMASLETLSPSTRSKQRQVLFRMLKDADYISAKGEIQPFILPHGLASILTRHPELPRLIFPADVSHV